MGARCCSRPPVPLLQGSRSFGAGRSLWRCPRLSKFAPLGLGTSLSGHTPRFATSQPVTPVHTARTPHSQHRNHPFTSHEPALCMIRITFSQARATPSHRPNHLSARAEPPHHITRPLLYKTRPPSLHCPIHPFVKPGLLLYTVGSTPLQPPSTPSRQMNHFFTAAMPPACLTESARAFIRLDKLPIFPPVPWPHRPGFASRAVMRPERAFPSLEIPPGCDRLVT